MECLLKATVHRSDFFGLLELSCGCGVVVMAPAALRDLFCDSRLPPAGRPERCFACRPEEEICMFMFLPVNFMFRLGM